MKFEGGFSPDLSALLFSASVIIQLVSGKVLKAPRAFRDSSKTLIIAVLLESIK